MLVEAAITELFGVGNPTAPPVAALSYQHDFGQAPPGPCLRADPVHLRADTNGLVLFDATTFELNDTDSRALAARLNEHLGPTDCRLQWGHPHRWYLLCESGLPAATDALPQRRGASVAAAPIAHDKAALWTTRLNEFQMLLHTHPLNQQRAARGQAVVNSVWLWGGGELDLAGLSRFNLCMAADACALGAADLCAMATLDPDEGPGPLLQAMVCDSQALLVVDACREAGDYGDFAAWHAGVQTLDVHWLSPLLTALRAGHIDRLDLLPLDGRCYRLEKRQLCAFWKRVRDYREVISDA